MLQTLVSTLTIWIQEMLVSTLTIWMQDMLVSTLTIWIQDMIVGTLTIWIQDMIVSTLTIWIQDMIVGTLTIWIQDMIVGTLTIWIQDMIVGTLTIWIQQMHHNIEPLNLNPHITTVGSLFVGFSFWSVFNSVHMHINISVRSITNLCIQCDFLRYRSCITKCITRNNKLKLSIIQSIIM